MPTSASIETDQSFRPKRANLFAGVILGVGFILGPLALALFLVLRDAPPRRVEPSMAANIMIGLIVVVIPLIGVFLLYCMKNLFTHRVDLGREGFVYSMAGDTNSCRWANVEKIQEVLTEESLKVINLPGGRIHNLDRSFVIKMESGDEFQFTVNSIDRLPEFAKHLEDACERFDLPWERIAQ